MPRVMTEPLTDRRGNALAGITLDVFVDATDVVTTLYTARTGGASVTGSDITTNQDGYPAETVSGDSLWWETDSYRYELSGINTLNAGPTVRYPEAASGTINASVHEAMFPSLTDPQWGGQGEDQSWDDAMDAVLDSRPNRGGGVIIPPSENPMGMYLFNDEITMGQTGSIMGMHSSMYDQALSYLGPVSDYDGNPITLDFPNDTNGIVSPNEPVDWRCHHPKVSHVTLKGSGRANGKTGVLWRDNELAIDRDDSTGRGIFASGPNVGLQTAPGFGECYYVYAAEFSTGFSGDNVVDGSLWTHCWAYECETGFLGGSSEDTYDKCGTWHVADTCFSTEAAGGRFWGCQVITSGGTDVIGILLRGAGITVGMGTSIHLVHRGVVFAAGARGCKVVDSDIGVTSGLSIGGHAIQMADATGNGSPGDVERCVVANNVIRSWGQVGVPEQRGIVAYNGTRNCTFADNTFQYPDSDAVRPGAIELAPGVEDCHVHDNIANDEALLGREWIDLNPYGQNKWGANTPAFHCGVEDVTVATEADAKINEMLEMERGAGRIRLGPSYRATVLP